MFVVGCWMIPDLKVNCIPWRSLYSYVKISDKSSLPHPYFHFANIKLFFFLIRPHNDEYVHCRSVFCNALKEKCWIGINLVFVEIASVHLYICQQYTLCFIERPCIIEKSSSITMYWNHFNNTSQFKMSPLP